MFQTKEDKHMMNLRIWLDNTMAQRLSVKWMTIYGILMVACVGFIIRFCIRPYHMIFTDMGIYLIDFKWFVPVLLIGLLYSAWQFADEVRFLKGEES